MRPFAALLLCSAAAAISACGVQTTSSPAPPDACAMASAHTVTAGFPLGFPDNRVALVADETTSTCAVLVRQRGGDVNLIITASVGGRDTLVAVCTGTTEPVAGVGEAACWNAASATLSTTRGGTFFSLTATDPVTGPEQRLAIQGMLLSILSQ